MMDSLSLSRVTSNDDETDMLIPRRNFHTKEEEEKKIIQPIKGMESLQLGMYGNKTTSSWLLMYI